MPLDITDDKSSLVQVMAWCRQANVDPDLCRQMASLGLNELNIISSPCNLLHLDSALSFTLMSIVLVNKIYFQVMHVSLVWILLQLHNWLLVF